MSIHQYDYLNQEACFFFRWFGWGFFVQQSCDKGGADKDPWEGNMPSYWGFKSSEVCFLFSVQTWIYEKDTLYVPHLRLSRAIYFKARRVFLLWSGSLKRNYQILSKPVLHLCCCFICSNLKCWGWNSFWWNARRKVKPSFSPWAPFVIVLYLRFMFCGLRNFLALLWQMWAEFRMCVSFPDSDTELWGCFCGARVVWRELAELMRCSLWVWGHSLPALALLVLWAVFSFGGGCRGARRAHAVLTQLFPGWKFSTYSLAKVPGMRCWCRTITKHKNELHGEQPALVSLLPPCSWISPGTSLSDGFV